MPSDSKSREVSPEEMLFPGRVVVLDDKKKLTAIVFPPALNHVRAFSRDVVGAAMALMKAVADTKKNDDATQRMVQVLTTMVPYILTNAMDLVSKCTRIECPGSEGLTLEKLPHWYAPPVVEAWIEEAFGDETKVRPWKAAIETLMSKSTGKKFSISEMLSQLSSPRATAGTTSSSTANTAAPTPAGASAS
jgi:hypothetical protein